VNRRRKIAAVLSMVAVAGLLSACHVHDHGYGAVYRPHHETVRTGPVRTRTTVISPRREDYRDNRHHRVYRHPGPGHREAPDMAKRHNPPAHGLHGTQPGHNKPKRGLEAPGTMSATSPANRNHKAILNGARPASSNPTSNVLKNPATKPKSPILTKEPHTESGILKRHQKEREQGGS